MKKLSIATTAAAALLATAALAQQTPPRTTAPGTPPAATAPAPTATMPSTTAKSAMTTEPKFIKMQTNSQWLASNLIGTTVHGPANESLGDINELVIDSDGRVAATVIGVGGFLGLGEKDVAVPFKAMAIRRDGDDLHLVLNTTKEELKAAPAFKTHESTAAMDSSSKTKTN